MMRDSKNRRHLPSDDATREEIIREERKSDDAVRDTAAPADSARTDASHADGQGGDAGQDAAPSRPKSSEPPASSAAPVNDGHASPAPKTGSRFGSVRRLLGVFFDTFLVRNIVLVKMIGLCPILVVAVNLKYGVTLTVCAGIALIPAAFLMSLIGNKLKPAARAPLYTLLASTLLVGAAYVVDTYISPELYAALYLYLPLMAVNTLVTYRAGGFAVTSGPVAALADALGSTLGFGLVICAVSAIREILTFGTLWDIRLMETPLLPAAGTPFLAFVLLALLAALLQFVRALLRRFVEGEVIPTDV